MRTEGEAMKAFIIECVYLWSAAVLMVLVSCGLPDSFSLPIIIAALFLAERSGRMAERRITSAKRILLER